MSLLFDRPGRKQKTPERESVRSGTRHKGGDHKQDEDPQRDDKPPS